MKDYIMSSLKFLALVIPTTAMALAPGEGILVDRNTGDYVINYANGTGRLMQSRFVPSTKIDPLLRSKFENRGGVIRYRYTIKNGSTSKQPLIGLIFDSVSSIWSGTPLPKTSQEENRKYMQASPTSLTQVINDTAHIVEAPNGWSCDVMPVGEKVWAGYRIPCSYDDLDENMRNGLQAGETLPGFGFSSMDLPGVGIGRLSGFGDMGPSFVDAGPHGEIANQLEALQKNDYVPRYAAIPAISVPAPFDAAALLSRIHAQMLTWVGMQLLDPAFATQLDRYMVAAANAYRNNQPKAGKENIDSVRKLLAHEHLNLDHDDEDNDDTPEHKAATRLTIDRLAARVLDFDLRYVLHRMAQENGRGGR